jgi:hypothetical protein
LQNMQQGILKNKLPAKLRVMFEQHSIMVFSGSWLALRV